MLSVNACSAEFSRKTHAGYGISPDAGRSCKDMFSLPILAKKRNKTFGPYWVELAPGAPVKLFQRFFRGEGRSVDLVSRHGFIGVDDRHEAAFERDRLSSVSCGVPFPVPPSVVQTDRLRQVGKFRKERSDTRPCLRVALDEQVFFVRQRSRFFGNLRRDLGKPDVVVFCEENEELFFSGAMSGCSRTNASMIASHAAMCLFLS